MHLSAKQVLAALIVATAATSAVAPVEEPSWKDVLYSFENANPTDFFHMGDDGVLRHFNESGTVLNYAQLSPRQISQSISDSSSLNTAESKDHLSRVFKNVDGHNVKGPALMNPPPGIYPTAFLNNRQPSEASEVLQPDFGLTLKRQCVPRRCFPGDKCKRYPDCRRCVVRDLFKEGECE